MLRVNLRLVSSRNSVPQVRAFLVHRQVVNSVTETPHGLVPWEIGRSTRTIMELLPSVIRKSTVQKKCQKGVNTRENASRRRSASLYQQTRAHPQPIVPLWRFPCCSLSLLDVSQTCSQLI